MIDLKTEARTQRGAVTAQAKNCANSRHSTAGHSISPVQVVLSLAVALALPTEAQAQPAAAPPGSTPVWAPAEAPVEPAPPASQEREPEWIPSALSGAPPGAPGAGTARPLGSPRQAASPAAALELLGLQDELGVPGGLTARQAARQAAATSREAERLAGVLTVSEADENRIKWSSAPRLAISASYTRLSPITNPSLGSPTPEGTLVGVNGPPGPITPDSELVGFTFAAPDLTFPVLLNNYTLLARLSVPVSDYLFKLGQTLRGVRAAREGSRLDVQVARLRAATEAQLEYYRWVQARLSMLISDKALEQAQRRLGDVSKLFLSGRGVNADVLQAQAFAAESELAVQRARSQELLAERRLRLRMHAAASSALSVGEAILDDDGSLTEFSEDASLLYDEALNQRLEIAALVANDRALAHAIGTRRNDKLPVVEVFGDLRYSNPNPRIFPQQTEFATTWDVGIELRWAVNDLGVVDADVATREVERIQLRSQLNEIQEQLQLEILTALRELTEARQNVHTSKQAQQAAEAAYGARAALFQNGRATNLEVLQAETTRFNSHLGLVGAHIAVKMARVRLEHALGRNGSILKELGRSKASAPR